MVKRIILGLSLLLLTQSAQAATESECWDKWYAQQIALQPGPEDTVDPRNGKSLSQTDGAKRSRAKKLQALKDALELRGKSDSKWEAFRTDCAM